MPRSRPSRLLVLALWLAAAPALARQEDVLVPLQPPPTVAPDALTQARAAAARNDPAEALSRYLRILSARPDDVQALAGAGRAALDVGDVNAAAGFLARAEARDPRNGAVKAGLALALMQRGDPRGALRLFREAVDLGVPVATIAADRGLAYDLRGSPARAQADYRLALGARPDDETLRRLAVSQAIGGDRVAALATLDPLLRRQDVPAWRARAFIFALTGDPADARTAAALVMPRDQVEALAPYLPRLAALKAGDKAAAIHLGRFPGDAPPPTRMAASSFPPLVPNGSAMPTPDPFAPVAVMPTGSAEEDRRAREHALADALADARARAAARARVPAAIRARGGRLTPMDVRIARQDVTPAIVPAPIPAPAAPPPTTPLLTATTPLLTSTRPPSPAATPPLLAQTTAPPITTTPLPAAAPPVSEAPPRPAAALPFPAVVPRVEAAPTAAQTRPETAVARKQAQANAAAKKKDADARKAEADDRKTKQREPARHWVQVAGGANKTTLPRAWAGLKDKWPKQLAGRAPWTMHYRFTNRLLIGPFPSSDAAQDWVTKRREEGFATFRVETNAGDPVERLGGA